uniref:non-specific serine/threonine protein kinase n=1 Tax=Nicotiana tabacum TaxID=4097 RepID=A0A1S3X166_TOBAC
IKLIAKGRNVVNLLIISACLYLICLSQATVAYYLVYDNRSLASSGYLAAEFQESMDGYSPGLFPNLDLQLSTGNGISQEANLRQPFSKEKKWLVGLQSPANPREIMNQVLGTLQELNVRWKKIGHFNMKCLWCHDLDFHSMASNHMNDDHFISNATALSTHFQPQTAVKFEMQLYKTPDDKYLLDLQRISGPQFLFLDFCAVFIMQLEAPQ